LQDYADLFCELYDALDEDEAREHAHEWLHDDSFDSLAKSFLADVLKGRTPEAMRTRIDNWPTAQPLQVGGDVLDRRRLACLVGLDRAFAHLNPALRPRGERLPEPLVELQARLDATGRLDSGEIGGALLVRVVRRGTMHESVTSKRDLVTTVVRVPAPTWERCELVRPGEGAAILQHELSAGLRVGCVPVIADPAELRFEVGGPRGHRRYTIFPADRAVTRRRIPQIVQALDEAGVVLGLAPELTLSGALLDAWVQALRAPERGSTRLRMLLAGSGPGLGRSSNTAVLLDGRTGAVIARQGKMFPFDFSTQELQRWRLEDRLGNEPVAEDLVHGRSLAVIDVGAMRIAIAVCEDLARPLDIGPLLRDLGVSHLLTPVFSRPLRERRWEQTGAAVHVRETGTLVIVANSLAMSEITGVQGGTALLLAHGQEAMIECCTDPAQVACFTLLRDGTARSD